MARETAAQLRARIEQLEAENAALKVEEPRADAPAKRRSWAWTLARIASSHLDRDRDRDEPVLDLPSRDVFAAGGGTVIVAGPALEAEASAVHDGFWG